MVGVVVRCENTGHRHVVDRNGVDQIVDGVGRVDQHALTGLAITDCIDEVHHLLGERIIDGEVLPGEQLTEVQTIVAHRCPSVAPRLPK